MSRSIGVGSNEDTEGVDTTRLNILSFKTWLISPCIASMVIFDLKNTTVGLINSYKCRKQGSIRQNERITNGLSTYVGVKALFIPNAC